VAPVVTAADNPATKCRQGSKAYCYAAAVNAYVHHQTSEAKQLANQGCKLGDTDTCLFELTFHFQRPLTDRLRQYCEWGSRGACGKLLHMDKIALGKHQNQTLAYLDKQCTNFNEAACAVLAKHRRGIATKKQKAAALNGCRNKDEAACYMALDILPWDKLKKVIDTACDLRLELACIAQMLHSKKLNSRQKARARAFCKKGHKHVCPKILAQLSQAKANRLMHKACANNPKMCGYKGEYFLKHNNLLEAVSAFEEACNDHAPQYCYYLKAINAHRYKDKAYQQALFTACDYLQQTDHPICRQYFQVKACGYGNKAGCKKLALHFMELGNATAAKTARP